MALDGSEFAALFEAHGQEVTLVHRTPGTWDPDSQTGTLPSETEEPVIGIVRGFAETDIDGENILVSDRRILLDPSTVSSAPNGDDEVEISGVRHAVVHVRTFASGLNVLAYNVQIRGTV